MIFNMNDAKPTKGWNQIMTLPRRLTLAGKDDLRIEPSGDIESLRTDHRHVGTTPLPPNQEYVLENIRGNAMEIVAEIETRNAPMFEMNVLGSPNSEEYTRIAFFGGRGYRGKSLITIDSSYASRAPETINLLGAEPAMPHNERSLPDGFHIPCVE